MKKIYRNVIENDHIVFTFMRSAFASLCSAVTDIGSRIFFFSILLCTLPEFYRSNISVALGAIIGGVVNCVVNYKFTFHAEGQNKAGVAVKFVICWVGNLLLNMYGTTLALITLKHWADLESYGISNDKAFAFLTLSVAIIVSIFWNFPIQRYFVFRNNWLDRLFLNRLNSRNYLII